MDTERCHASLLSCFFGMRPLFVLVFLLSFLQQSAHAAIWGYVDGKGVAHFATERLDERYEIFFHGGESFDTGRGLKVQSDTPRPVTVSAAPPRLIAFFDVSPSYKRVEHHLREASSTHQIDYELLQALIVTESGFDAAAVSPKGAVGLMQIMPLTAQRYGIRSDKHTPVAKKLTDPGINIRTGARYLRDLMNLFPGKLDLVLAAYNAGEGAVQRAGNRVPNYKETQDYVRTVLQLYTVLKPPARVADHRRVPSRVRMEMQGGAARRGNMVAPLQAAADPSNFKIEAD